MGKNTTRTSTENALRLYLSGKMQYHAANVEIYFENPAGIGEHPDVLGALENELGKVAEYKEKLDILSEICENG